MCYHTTAVQVFRLTLASIRTSRVFTDPPTGDDELSVPDGRLLVPGKCDRDIVSTLSSGMAKVTYDLDSGGGASRLGFCSGGTVSRLQLVFSSFGSGSGLHLGCCCAGTDDCQSENCTCCCASAALSALPPLPRTLSLRAVCNRNDTRFMYVPSFCQT